MKVKKTCFLLTLLISFGCGIQKPQSASSRNKNVIYTWFGYLNKYNSVITSNQLMVLKGVGCWAYNNQDHSCHCNVINYKMKVIRGNNVVFSDSSFSSYFSDRFNDYKDKIEENDLILLHDIQSRTCLKDKDSIVQVKPFIVTISKNINKYKSSKL